MDWSDRITRFDGGTRLTGVIGLPDVVTVPCLPGVFGGTEHRVPGPGSGVPGTGSRYWVPGPGVTEASSEYNGWSTDDC